MIDTHLNNINNNVNNTLLIFFNDNPRPSLIDMKYDCLNLYNPKPNPWFFYHINDYLTEILKYKQAYRNILLFGGSKGGSAAIIVGNLIRKKEKFDNVLCWVMSPVLNIEYGKSLKCKHAFISTAWDRVKNDKSIQETVVQFGKVYNYIDCSFPLMYSYSYNDKYWTFDKETFERVKDLECLTEDYIPCTDQLINFQQNKKPYQNIHNVLGYYWKADRELFYSKLNSFIEKHTS